MRRWRELDDGLRHIAALVKAQLGRDVADVPGAGAAGGLGYGAMVFFGAQLRRGIEIVLDLTGFDAAAAKADLIITGEGHLDGQSAQGKLIQGLCGRAQGKPVIALCGKLSATPDQMTIHRAESRLFHQPRGTAAGGRCWRPPRSIWKAPRRP